MLEISNTSFMSLDAALVDAKLMELEVLLLVEVLLFPVVSGGKQVVLEEGTARLTWGGIAWCRWW